MDNNDKEIKDYVIKAKKIPPTSYDYMINETLDSLPNKNKIIYNIKKFRKILATACCFAFIVSGVVFAKDIQKFFVEKFNSGKGIQTAVENGYIAKSNANYINSKVDVTKDQNNNILDSFEVGGKVGDFLMDDNRLSVEFEFQFDEKINQYKNLKSEDGTIDYENFGDLLLSNLTIMDDEKRIILFNDSEEEFDSFCKEHNLDYSYKEYNENYIDTSEDSLITNIDEENNIIKTTYNYVSNSNMPKSNHLTFFLKELTFRPKLDKEESIHLEGNWKFNIDIPKAMIDRESQYYKVVSCEKDNFDVYEAKATDTGFEIGITITGIEPPKMPDELAQKNEEVASANNGQISFSSKEEFISLYGDEKYAKMYSEYYNKFYPINVTGSPCVVWENKSEGTYILNSNKERFNCDMLNSNRKYNKTFKYIETYDENGFSKVEYTGEYDFYETFEMTKYDATDKIILVIDYYGEPVHIVLEKK